MQSFLLSHAWFVTNVDARSE